MGQSTNAYLFYGIELGDDLSDFLQEEDDTHGEVEQLLEKAGINGIQVGSHCSGDYPIYYLYTQSYMAWRGYSKEVDPASLVVSEEETEKLKKAMLVLKRDPVEPKWILASYWG